MENDYWWLLVLGTAFSVGVTVLFLYSLHLGLRKRRWWPLVVVVSVWLAGMVAYSGWDGERRRENARRRAEPLTSSIMPLCPPAQCLPHSPEVNAGG